MSLDIHLASSQSEAEKLYPSLSFDEDIHDIIFSDNNKWIKNFPLFMKMNDYYSDVYYDNENIEDLKCEINEIFSMIQDKNISEFFMKFVKVCEMAIKKNANIYCFCD